MSVARGLGWRFRFLQLAVIAVACLGLHLGVGDGFAVRDRSEGITVAVARTWSQAFRAIERQVARLGLPG